MKSVYSAVRTGSLNKAVCASSLKPTGYVMHQQFNIQQLYALPALYLCVLYLSDSPDCLHLLAEGGWWGLAGLNDLTGYAGGNFMFLVGPPKPDRS